MGWILLGVAFLCPAARLSGWATPRVLQIQPHALWLDTLLGPLLYALVTLLLKPSNVNIDSALIASLLAPIVHQSLVRFASDNPIRP